MGGLRDGIDTLWYMMRFGRMISLNRKGLMLMGECVQYGRGLSTYSDDMQIVPDNYELA